MLARFEQLMEQAVEGSLRRVFSTSLQPIQLAKAAARAMEQAQVIGLRGPEVPNVYELRLAAADLARFGDYAERLSSEVRAYLADYARERGLRPVAEPRVELVEDGRVRAGSVRTQARFAGLSPQVQQDVEAAIEDTRRLRLADLAAARAPRTGVRERLLRLSDDEGLDVALEPRMDVVRLGRAIDNDVVVASQRVSRYHAQLRWVKSSWLVYDLDSTNGTWVDEQKIGPGKPRVLRAGSRLRVGDHPLQVHDARGRS
jgi:hypothetical protein